MANLVDLLTPFVGERLSPVFRALLIPHIGAGLTCVVSGAGAILSTKGPGRHPTFGAIYFWALLVVFLSSSVMSLLRWSRDNELFVLGAVAFLAASIGYVARKFRWDGWPAYHIMGMGSSYIVLLTAFYVDNGPHLPLWNRLPNVAFWILPAAVGAPFIIRALRRHPLTRRSAGFNEVMGNDGHRCDERKVTERTVCHRRLDRARSLSHPEQEL